MANNERQFESFPPPVFTCDGHFVKAIFARPLPTIQKTIQKAIQKATQKTTQKKANESGNDRVPVETTEAVIDVIRAKHTVTISEMAYILGMSEIGVKYQLKVLSARGRIRRVGGRKQGYWALPFEEADSNNAASEGGAKSVVKSVVKTREKSVVKNSDQILAHLKENPSATRQQLAAETGLTIRGVERNLKVLKNAGRIRRVGPAKGGHWEVVNGQ